MKNGYKIHWTPNSLEELSATIEYVERNFGERQLNKLAQKIEEVTQLISQNPELFPKSEYENVYRVAILKFNTMYYRVRNNEIEILSFFSNRQNPDKRRL